MGVEIEFAVHFFGSKVQTSAAIMQSETSTGKEMLPWSNVTTALFFEAIHSEEDFNDD